MNRTIILFIAQLESITRLSIYYLLFCSSGHGDQILRNSVAFTIARYFNLGLSLENAVHEALLSLRGSKVSSSVAAIDKNFNTVIESTAQLFYVSKSSASDFKQILLQPTTFKMLPEHVIHETEHSTTGLTRFPTSKGQIIAISKKARQGIFSLGIEDFLSLMSDILKVAMVIEKYYEISRCALVYEGREEIKLVPLFGLSKEWKPIKSQSEEFHEHHPGYISSHNGPRMNDARLDAICSKIRSISGLSIKSPCNYQFKGKSSNANLFARIIQGKIEHWRIWEDDNYVAFLTPFPNTPGYTVLVPRLHLSSDIFSLKQEEFYGLTAAAKKVANILKIAFDTTSECGMIFEGLEVDYAHVKIIPIHQKPSSSADGSLSEYLRLTPFETTYQGHVTSLSGPLSGNTDLLAKDADSIRILLKERTIRAPHSWKDPKKTFY